MLEIKDLRASIEGKEILKGINLNVNAGEVHAIMGPNGSGKSTLSAVLTGNPAFTVTGGSVTFNGKDLLALSPEDRAHEGLFLSFQYPVEIPGVSMVNFMRAAINEKRKYYGQEPLSAADFLKLMREKRVIVQLDNKLASRAVNEGFSGGEKTIAVAYNDGTATVTITNNQDGATIHYTTDGSVPDGDSQSYSSP
ncbi:MAG: ATP-binding cassette domain-containing protein, partial [Muribaculaceae bacterium]|nr:ATP-binding cassette domain-containing protein [Muribaculaceae bacterium]